MSELRDALRIGEPRLALLEVEKRALCAQQITHPVTQHGPRDRLRNEVGCPDLVGAVDRCWIIQSGDHQNRSVFPAVELAQSLAGLETVEDRHHYVKQDEVRLESLERCQAGLAVVRFLGGAPGLPECYARDQAHE